uniref:hypothetical protein n=1 Tax=Listeria seeligeri TaxID=1640 RepID=UPI001D11591F|nr:hypothetical protein [Listeria seeligeri]UCK61834.1 hypothetical protein pLIS51_00146 [Listeria seeligeri]
MFTISLLDSFEISEKIKIALSIIIVLIITLLLSFILMPFISIAFSKVINHFRRKQKLASYDAKSVKSKVFNFKNNKALYIFDFDNNLICAGYSNWITETDNVDFDMTLSPFDDEIHIHNIHEMNDFVYRKDTDSEIYINFDKKIKIFIIHSFSE